MIDWTAPMNQTFEFYRVDPATWTDAEQLTFITSGSILRDLSVETLGSASFDITQEIGEIYVRTYLFVEQGNESDKCPLGVFLVQTPERTFDGRNNSMSLDAYTPLIELKDNNPPLGYTILGGTNILDIAGVLTQNAVRAPVVYGYSDKTIESDFVAEPDDSWLGYLMDLLNNAKYDYGIDEMGRILFEPRIEIKAMQPVYTFNDDNSSILYPEVTVSRDLYGVPNVVELVYSDDYRSLYSRAENHNENSPTSIENRGRIVLYRETNPSFSGAPTQEILDGLAQQTLESLSSLEYTVTYKHGYLPTVRVGDCVRLNYEAAGIRNVKAKVIKQSITLESGCPVEETAIYTLPVLPGRMEEAFNEVVEDEPPTIVEEEEITEPEA